MNIAGVLKSGLILKLQKAYIFRGLLGCKNVIPEGVVGDPCMDPPPVAAEDDVFNCILRGKTGQLRR
jgi:hypothetical protein